MKDYPKIKHPLVGKKVVFLDKYNNDSCFVFYTAFELLDKIRLATEDEIKEGRRLHINPHDHDDS